MLSRIVRTLCLVFLTGCQGATVYVSGPAQTPESVSLGVSSIEVVVDADADRDQSHRWVSSSFMDQVRNWLQRRFYAAGGEKKAYLVLRRVDFKETILQKEKGFIENFRKQPSEQYDIRLDVAFEIRDAVGFPEQSATAQVQRTVTVLEGVSLADRENFIQKALNQALLNVDSELLQNIRASMPLLLQQNTPESLPDGSNSFDPSFHP